MATNATRRPAAHSHTWLDTIVSAMRHLGGTATLTELYDEIVWMRKDLPDSWKAVVSRVIQNHSSDASDFSGSDTDDVFYSVDGLGSGKWGLRAKRTDDEVKSTPQEDPQTALLKPAGSFPVIHYALDLESPPVIACETHMPGAISSPIASRVTCPDCKATEHFPQLSLPIQPEAIPTIRGYDVLMKAAVLIGDGVGPEYDRAIVDFTSDLIGAGPDDSILIARILRSLAEGK
jgi:hypothetical protein